MAKVMSLQGEEGLWWHMGTKDLAVCLKVAAT